MDDRFQSLPKVAYGGPVEYGSTYTPLISRPGDVAYQSSVELKDIEKLRSISYGLDVVVKPTWDSK